MKFKSIWQDTKNPKEVKFPDGSIETVQYMRDGICLFISGNSANYERTGAHEAEFTTLDTITDVNKAVENYKEKAKS